VLPVEDLNTAGCYDLYFLTTGITDQSIIIDRFIHLVLSQERGYQSLSARLLLVRFF
jgi:hypothetical protein